MVSLVYEDKYIKKYNSIVNGYNVERTLFKMINGEIGIYSNTSINRKHIKMLISTIKNIHNNNGKYIKRESSQSKPSPKKVYAPKSSDNVNINYSEISFKDCINYICNTYELNCSYNDIYTKFRELNIFYYDENKINKPNNEYINKYFIVQQRKLLNGTEYETIKVLQDGKEFVKETLLNNKIIYIKQ